MDTCGSSGDGVVLTPVVRSGLDDELLIGLETIDKGCESAEGLCTGCSGGEVPGLEQSTSGDRVSVGRRSLSKQRGSVCAHVRASQKTYREGGTKDAVLERQEARHGDDLSRAGEQGASRETVEEGEQRLHRRSGVRIIHDRVEVGNGIGEHVA